MGKKVKLGLIGLGGRGMGLLKLVFVHHEDVEFAAVCDVYEDRCQEAAKAVEEAGRPRPLTTQNYKEILAMPEVDAVILCTSWEKPENMWAVRSAAPTAYRSAGRSLRPTSGPMCR